jgi:hypothetical protein
MIDLLAVTYDARDPGRLAAFWGGLLRREVVDDPYGGVAVLPGDDVELMIRFVPSELEKLGPNQIHFDLTSATPEDQQATVAQALELGARHLDIGQGPDARHVVLADPEGNEFDVIEAGNHFLAGCGAVGALASDGTQALGYFWSEALGWPLVWDENEETAIQSPRGGSKITWGGPPVAAKLGKNRLHLDVITGPGGDLAVAVERLVRLGATPIDLDQGDVPWAIMADVDGNEFCVYPPAA